MSSMFQPRKHQAALPTGQLILAEKPGEEAVPMDVVFVGAGPAGLCGAIELKRLVKAGQERGEGIGDVEVAVLEKAAALGEHSLSGAVVNPRALRELFPELRDGDFPLRRKVEKEAVFLLTVSGQIPLPTPPTMRNHGNYVASICEIVRWLGEKAEALGVNLFTGFPADSLLVDGGRVVGVRTTPSGLDKGGLKGGSYGAPTDVSARVVALSEGTRGALTQAWLEWSSIGSSNPQIYALGVKELWETKTALDTVIHTMGWPLPRDAFGGSFLYPLEDNLVAIGLVVGLDYHDAGLDVHHLLQVMKKHPLFHSRLRDGEMIEWGAKTIPEGGYYSLPSRRSGDGLVILGDSAGYVDVPSLKGIHYAMQSGIYAARAIYRALKGNDTSAQGLSDYDRLVDDSYIAQDLRRTRNMRLAFKKGFFAGGLQSALMTATNGRFPGSRIAVEEDSAQMKSFHSSAPREPYDGKLTFSKVDAVFKSGNATRDTIPVHLKVADPVDAEVARFYSHLCPAGVYEWQDGALRINAPNCVDCKATDVLGPRWTPREGGSGPRYRGM